MKKKILILFLLAMSVSFGQERKISKANKGFDNFGYIDAQNIYQKVADKGYESADLYKRLGDSYYLNASYENAQVWYAKLIEKYIDAVDAETYFRYAISLRATKNYRLSDEIMLKFQELKRDDKRAQLFKESPDYLEKIEKQRGSYTVDSITINSGYSDFGATLYKDKLIFASARDTGGFTKRRHEWNGQPFLDLYEVDTTQVTLEDGLKYVKKYKGAINSKFHESTPVFSTDGNTVYFTRNNFNNGKYREDNDGINKLKIYKAVLNQDGKWSKAQELPFCSDEYTVSHPTLSADNKRLYFASDMEGTFGKSDIWYVDILEDGSYGAPVNMGAKINTEGRESFPHMTTDNELYFASNGHLGLGGLDLFVTTVGDQGEVSDITNLGEPVNSPKDDFAYTMDTTSNIGFISSNRGGEAGNDDIYIIKQLKKVEPPCDIVLSGTVLDKDTGEKLSGVKVEMYDTNKNVFESSITDPTASFIFNPICDKIIIIRAEKEGYTPVEKMVTIPSISSNLTEEILMEKARKPLGEGDDLAKILDLNPIYFDFDKFNIRSDAAIELAKVQIALEEYPTLKIDIRSHTDSRGNDDYNMRLSQKRNEATISWLIENGIDTSRLTGRGYGESQPVNECTNGKQCSEDEHQRNRRSEFIILGDM